MLKEQEGRSPSINTPFLKDVLRMGDRPLKVPQNVSLSFDSVKLMFSNG
ncbi:MAG: hypothetical protein IGR76_00785 [Synechococcales cyanobacterium T60_A2020_003]|nr:hypothetical protein [Synechococcales cyanobacterium T60_A2020_003]